MLGLLTPLVKFLSCVSRLGECVHSFPGMVGGRDWDIRGVTFWHLKTGGIYCGQCCLRSTGSDRHQWDSCCRFELGNWTSDPLDHHRSPPGRWDCRELVKTRCAPVFHLAPRQCFHDHCDVFSPFSPHNFAEISPMTNWTQIRSQYW